MDSDAKQKFQVQIPDIVKLFSEIELPTMGDLNNRKIWLSLYYHSLK